MSVADVQTEQDDATEGLSRPDAGEIFLSRREELRLVRLARYPTYGISGQKTGETRGEAIQFRENRFFCPYTGDVELADGQKADAGEILEWLKEHRLHGNASEGFWKVDQAAPTVSQAEMQLLMDAVMALDVEALEKIVTLETHGWGRQAIIEPARRAIDQITAAQAAQAAKPAAPKGK